MAISVNPGKVAHSCDKRLPAGRREAFKLKALRDFTLCMGRSRDFDESLHLALMVILGTYSIAKGALFLEEDGEFRVRVSRGLPPGIPPIDKSADLVAALRRTRRPVSLGRTTINGAIRKAASDVERAVPTFTVEFLCPLGARNGYLGILVLGPTFSGEPMTVRQRETLSVMTSFLSTHISNQRVIADISRLNDVLRFQMEENERLIDGMREIYIDTIRALATAIEAKDPYTRGHSERVAKISVSIAKGLDLPEGEVEAIHIASILHDVGKIGTAKNILNKPSALTPEEIGEVRKHPRTSFEILSKIRFPYPNVALLARDHHELLDGSGYPAGKREHQIPIGSRIIALADAFDAMVSDRPYRDGLSLVATLTEIRSCIYRHYDPNVARVFLRYLRNEISGESPVPVIFPELRRGYSRVEALDIIVRTLRDLN
ncbi:MAG: HD-GYP domain-containing protein [Deltaproteobacteria bacterium]|nr:HD-GYP domain-containing protein [Deltaproteobacteria bacterium]